MLYINTKKIDKYTIKESIYIKVCCLLDCYEVMKK